MRLGWPFLSTTSTPACFFVADLNALPHRPPPALASTSPQYHPSWHCIVGRSFGSQVTHDDTHMIHFLMGEVGFLLWRTAPPKAAPGAEADDVES